MTILAPPLIKEPWISINKGIYGYPPLPIRGIRKKDVSMLGDSFFIFGPAHEAPRMLQSVMKFKI